MYIKLFQRNIIVLSDAEVLRKAFRSPEYRELLNNKPKGICYTGSIPFQLARKKVQVYHYENTPIQIKWKFSHQKMKNFR